jgi:hypothetical protein
VIGVKNQQRGAENMGDIFQARQGDILFIGVTGAESLLGDSSERVDTVLAHGEATGHSHRLVGPAGWRPEMRTRANGEILVRGGEGMRVVHEEHGDIALPADTWILVRRQREYDPVAAERQRRVSD